MSESIKRVIKRSKDIDQIIVLDMEKKGVSKTRIQNYLKRREKERVDALKDFGKKRLAKKAKPRQIRRKKK